MSSNLQKTIREPIEFKGVGLHNGIDANLCLKPAEANSGIKFRRTDVDFDKSIIEANYENVNSPILCTKIKNQHGFSVSTIEHLMAAFYIEGIDNVLVEIDAPEVPILDGSAFDFVEAIRSALRHKILGQVGYISKQLSYIAIKFSFCCASVWRASPAIWVWLISANKDNIKGLFPSCSSLRDSSVGRSSHFWSKTCNVESNHDENS